jgi:uncharacterized protein
MKQYIITALDHTDPDAPSRRQANRPAHLALGDYYRTQGHHLYAAAILDANEAMIGSMMVVQFKTEEELENWLDQEPYVTGNVWNKINIKPCRVAPSYLTKVESAA